MTIDRRLYQQVTGKVPGEALNRMGESMARRGPRVRGDTSTWGALMRGRWFIRVGAALAMLIGVLYFLFFF